ncbi:alpha-1A adrenergic receptor-like [Xyrauchen texanus]|uniref:alpha-1A adrenergic receptor-like n=1 Tax=Xyrauchen texanus TaxID=154827 RepID=UPI00224211FC|nr:alpha-1A adrenergic receptor-like [Xyrauchen texanus]
MNSDTDQAVDLLNNGSAGLYAELLSQVPSNVSNSTRAANGTEVSSFSLARAVPLGMVLGAFIVFAIVGNILVILSVVCNRHLRIPTNYFIINLAMADLLLGTTVLPVSATLEILNYWVFGRIFCDIWAAVDVLCCTASIMSLCVISIDRYIGVRYPLQYPSIVTEKRALLAMLGVWVLAIVISIGPLLGWKEPPSEDNTVCLITEEPFYALFSSLGSFYIPLAVILAMYCRVYVVAKRTTRNLEVGVMKERMDSSELTLRIHYKGSSHTQEDCKGHTRSSLTLKLLKFSREKKAAKTLGVVVGMFILCWLPFFLALPIGSFNASLRPPETFFKVIFWLGYFNSCLNPIIYPCYSREFKQAFIRILRCQCQQRKQQRWRMHNYRAQNGSANHAYADTNSICMNGSQQTLASIQPSPKFLRRGVDSCPASRLLPGWGPCTSSSSLSGSPIPGMIKARSEAMSQSPCKPSRMALLLPSGPHAKGPQHANGQNGKGEAEYGTKSRPTPETTM